MNPFYNNAIAQKAIHIVKSLKNPQHKSKLVNKYVFANATEKEAQAYNTVYSK